MKKEYWSDCVDEALDQIGIEATPKQREDLADAMACASEMESEATGRHYIPNPLESELREARAELEKERALIFCKRCKGTGRLLMNYGGIVSDSDCFKCRGRGKHLP